MEGVPGTSDGVGRGQSRYQSVPLVGESRPRRGCFVYSVPSYKYKVQGGKKSIKTGKGTRVTSSEINNFTIFGFSFANRFFHLHN